MAIDARLAYVENEILQADPIRLVRMLYGGALGAIAKARVHLREGDVRERSRQITRALDIVSELMLSLDRERGGEIATNLAELYDYVNRRLQDANFRQIEEPLIEVERLMATLLDGWEQCNPAPPPPTQAAAAPPSALPAHFSGLPASGMNDDFPTYAPPRMVIHG